jgi:hypothetical protein
LAEGRARHLKLSVRGNSANPQIECFHDSIHRIEPCRSVIAKRLIETFSPEFAFTGDFCHAWRFGYVDYHMEHFIGVAAVKTCERYSAIRSQDISRLHAQESVNRR